MDKFYELIFFGQDDVGQISDRIFRSIDSNGKGYVGFLLQKDCFHRVYSLLQHLDSWVHEREVYDKF